MLEVGFDFLKRVKSTLYLEHHRAMANEQWAEHRMRCLCLWENQSKLFEYLIIIKFKLNKNCLQSCDGILCHHIKKGSYNRRMQTCYSCYFNPRNGSFVSALSREADWVESVCDSGSFISINYSQWRLLNTLYAKEYKYSLPLYTEHSWLYCIHTGKAMKVLE